MVNVEEELRRLMDLYCDRGLRLEKERKEAKRYEDYDGVDTVDVLQRQCRKMIAELFQTMKRLGLLDEEEIAFGGIKKK
jgi:hypothetical protein